MGKLPLEEGTDSADAGPDDGDPRPVPADDTTPDRALAAAYTVRVRAVLLVASAFVGDGRTGAAAAGADRHRSRCSRCCVSARRHVTGSAPTRGCASPPASRSRSVRRRDDRGSHGRTAVPAAVDHVAWRCRLRRRRRRLPHHRGPGRVDTASRTAFLDGAVIGTALVMVMWVVADRADPHRGHGHRRTGSRSRSAPIARRRARRNPRLDLARTRAADALALRCSRSRSGSCSSRTSRDDVAAQLRRGSSTTYLHWPTGLGV